MAAPTPLSPTAAQLTSWGLDPAWSRRVVIDGADGRPVDLHLLDTGPGPKGTIVCVHGNPTWGYAWKGLLAELGDDWRVIAVDQVGMGYSERGRPRRLADRIAELVTLCRSEVDGPLVLVAHDWGGPVAVGAAASLEIDALVLCNTAVSKPEDVAVPPLIAAARRLVDLSCRRTPTFVAGTARMTAAAHREALNAPYRSADRRGAVRDFVADIPVFPSDPSHAALVTVADTFANLDCPILLLWGGRDPVFHDRFLRDLRRRRPDADVQRFPEAGHLVALDEPVGPIVRSWLETQAERPSERPSASTEAAFISVLAGIDERRDDTRPAYVGPDGILTWADLASRSETAAIALVHSAQLRPGSRVSLLIPPSPELLVATAAIWRAGAVPVVADASGGLRSLRKLVRAAACSLVVGTPSTLAIASALRLAPGARRAAFANLPEVTDLRHAPPGTTIPSAVLDADDVAAIVHTSGATGPAKPVRYTHGALVAQRTAMATLIDLGHDRAFTTSFGPFMLLAPSLGMACIRPDFPVDDASRLGFDELSAAIALGEVTTAWLSPASARSIVKTARGRTAPIDHVMLAGAPITARLASDVAKVTLGEVAAPFGMTECLPVTDGKDPGRPGHLGGTCVGRPIDGCAILIEPLAPASDADTPPWGDILVSAPWMFDGYDQSYLADAAAEVLRGGRRFHLTGDVGYLEDGHLFHLGRRQHVLETAGGSLASVSLEQPVAEALGVDVAAVGVGPRGAQVVALVISGDGPLRLSDPSLARTARSSSDHTIAAVLTGALPTDSRHRSKIDRRRLSELVGTFLAGR